MKHSKKTRAQTAIRQTNAVADSRYGTDTAKTAGARNEALGSEVEKKITGDQPETDQSRRLLASQVFYCTPAQDRMQG